MGSEGLAAVVWACSSLTTIVTAVVLIVKPVRERVLGIKNEDEGMKCLLRAEMLRTYHHNRELKKIRQYESENFLLLYAAYKAKGGNSFIDHIKSEVDGWEVIT